jgi:heme/copper-type cytochrome/quinol oxidase subunit 3
VNGENTKLAMMLFVTSESVFFLLLILTYIDYHHAHGNGPAAANLLDLKRTVGFSLCLFASSATMAAAVHGFRRRSRRWWVGGLLATLLLGATFLAGQVLEYADLFRRNVTISRDLFGTTFFTLTGFHGLHVALGLVLIATLVGLSLPGHGRPVRAGAAEAVSIYWHFVDGVWVVILSVVYLWALL